LFNPEVRAVYGNTGPVRESWTVGRAAVAEGEAEPIDGRTERSGISKYKARAVPGWVGSGGRCKVAFGDGQGRGQRD
jgi:hypothetical protein